MANHTRQANSSVSVVITAFNSNFFEEAVASAYAQTFGPSQVIVINDGSTDDTGERLRRLAPSLPSSFVWKTKPNGGVASAMNLGVRVALGDYIAFLDHDDIWHRQKLERQVQHFASVPGLALSFTDYECNYDSYRPMPGRSGYAASVIRHERWDPDPNKVLEYLLTARWPTASMSAVMIRREALACLPPFDERLTIASDLAMYLELAARRMKIDYLPEILLEYRWHGGNISRDVGRLWEDLCAIYDTFWENHAGDLPDHLRARALAGRAHWHLQTAIDAIRQGDTARARRHIVKAARIQPSAIRPGWVRMLGIGSPPAGAWPE
jgi:glycosyltransferase involved in cell wall biosynthesis